MNRWLAGALAGALCLGLGAAARAQESVDYRDHTAKKVATLDGAIEEETPLGIKIKTKTGVRSVPADDIVQIVYRVPGLTAAEFRKPFVIEARAPRAKDAKAKEAVLSEAIDAFRELDKQIRDKPAARRYVQYKIAQTQVEIARDNPAKVDDAIKALTEYKTLNPGGWEIVPAMKTLARLQEESGKSDDARKTYEELAEIPDVPREVKLESDLLVSRLLLRGGKYPEAEKKLKSVESSLPRDDPQRAFVQVYLANSQMGQGNLAQVEKQLNEAIKINPDARLRGLAHNLLGDYYRKKDQGAEAFWHYLRVDALYNEDPEEQAKALYYLRELFDKVKRDPVRAADCARRLKEDKRLSDTVYGKMATTDEKK